MTSRLPKTLLSVVAVLSLAATAFAGTQQPKTRLTAPIEDATRATLPGSQPLRVRQARDLGAVDGSTQLSSMSLVFNRTAAQQAALDALIAAQQNPASPQYHQWLTPAEFGARFGMADADIAKVEAWLQTQGFTVLGVSPSRDRITFSGNARAVASAFGVQLHHYRMPDGATHFAPSGDLTLPAALSGVVADVSNLSDFRPKPRVRYANGAAFRPNFTSAQTGNHFLTPLDVATIYDIKPAYNAGYNGTGTSIAIVGQSAVVTSDVTNFQTAIGQTAKAPTLILVPSTGNSEAYSGDESESDLDLEYTTGIAPGANIYFVYVGSNAASTVFDALTYAVQNDIAPIINISYGECEPGLTQSSYNTYNSSLQQAAAQGQTVISAAGDDGSTDCYGESGISTAVQTAPAVDFPSSSQYVTGVGGTEFPAADVTASTSTTTYFEGTNGSDVVSSALSYIPEQVWNDDSSAYPQEPLSAGGGGVSIFTALPSWQTGVPGIPSGSFRFVPDVSFDASPDNAPYAYCSSDQSAWASGQDGSCTSGLRDSVSQDLTVAGGTSFAAPIFAGMVAILNQAKGYTAQGVVNPTLYTLASNPSTYASAFHDIVTGGNECDLGTTYCSTTGAADYFATVGYDEASGLGSVDFNNLLTAWPAYTGSTSSAKSFTLASTAVSLTAGSNGTSNITITPVNSYTGTISWQVLPSVTVPDTCYSISNTAVSGSTNATLSIETSTSSSTCAAGYTALVQQGTTSASLHRPASPARRSRSAAPVTLAGLGLLSLGLLLAGPARRRTSRLPALLAILVLAGAGLGLSGCGGASSLGSGGGTGGGGGTTPTTTNYTVTVIGTDTTTSTITAHTTFTLSITN